MRRVLSRNLRIGGKVVHMMRNLLLCSALMLAACEPTTTRSGAGFTNYDRYAATRESELRGTAGPVLIEPTGEEVITGDELAAAGIGAGGSTGSTFQGGSTLATGGSMIQPATPGGNVGISDEQDFSAVSSRETIQSDAERRAAQAEAYRVIEPEPLPERPSSTGPNIVAFALSTRNQPGEQVYSRSGSNSASRLQKNCAKYATSDQAQEAFLEAGGPQRDRLGIDPDGDGFACYWDPRPFRSARSG
jgi:hypothetical protein